MITPDLADADPSHRVKSTSQWKMCVILSGLTMSGSDLVDSCGQSEPIEGDYCAVFSIFFKKKNSHCSAALLSLAFLLLYPVVSG